MPRKKKYHVDKVIKSVLKGNLPISMEHLVYRLDKYYDEITVGKARELVRAYISEFLSSNISGGVIYPYSVDQSKTIRSTLYHLWVQLVRLINNDGIVVGYRRLLPNVFVDGLDITLGKFHYSKLGYTPSNVVRAWENYFDDERIIKFRDSLDYRVGFNVRYVCDGKKHSCIDSIYFTMTSSRDILVHVNFSVSNLNRMGLLDLYLIHKFIRLVVPIQYLPRLTLSIYYGVITLDTDRIGWIARCPDLKKIFSEHFSNKKPGFKQVDISIDFARDPKIKRFGIDLFNNNGYGLEVLDGKESCARVIVGNRHSPINWGSGKNRES